MILAGGMLTTAYPVSAATPQAADSSVFLAQVASVLDTIQKTLRSLAVAIQSIADVDTSENAAATPSPMPFSSPTPTPAPSPTPYSKLSVPAAPVPPPPAPAEPTADEILLEQLKATFKRLQEQVAAQKAASTPASQPQPTSATPRLNAPAAGSPRAVTTSAGTFANIDDSRAPAKPQYAKDTIIVKFKDAAGEITFRKEGTRVIASKPSITQLLDRHRVSDVKKLVPHLTGPLAKIFVAKVPTVPVDGDILAIVDDFAKNQDVAYAEPNLIAYTTQVSTFTSRQAPNDPLYPQQWHHSKVSDPQAWAITQGSPNAVIAVIDTGVKWSHPDLAANIWQNAGEIPNNGIDDDRNGFIDDDKGWDFVETGATCWPGEDCTVEDNNPDDFHGHGTHVSGIAAAVTNNNIGVAGVCQLCKIMNVRAGFAIVPYQGASEPGGALEHDDIVQALTYAADNGAKVISMSFGGSGSQTMQNAIQYAYGRGVALVAAAGNSNSSDRNYPAAYPEVISVSATDQTDQRASFSSYGAWVDIAAPGVNILSTVIPGVQWGCRDTLNGYGFCSGTSMATPLTAGVIGLAFTRNPALTHDQVRTLMHSSVDPLTVPQYMGAGRINSFKAVQPAIVGIALLDPSLDGAYRSSVFAIRGTASGQNFSRYRVEFGGGTYPTAWTVIQSDTPTPVTNGILATWDAPSFNIPPGEYSVRLRVTDTDNRVWEDRSIVKVDTTLFPGWPKRLLESNGPFGVSPTLSDIDRDGDGEMFLQTIAQPPEFINRLYGIDHNGLPLAGWPISDPEFFGAQLSPAVGDLDGDGVPEIVSGRNENGATRYYVYNSNATLRAGWPVTLGTGYVNALERSSPVIANIDGERDQELIFVTRYNTGVICGGNENKIYIYKQNGQLLSGWPQRLSCVLQGTPAVGDIDQNGDVEIVVSTHAFGFATTSDLYVFNHDGTAFPGWPKQGVADFSSPVLADIDRNDGGKLEILQGGVDGGARFSIFNHDGTLVPGFPVRGIRSFSYSPAVGDIDGDGNVEVVFTASDGTRYFMYALRKDGTNVPGWPITIENLGNSPILVDLNGDGRMEIVIVSYDRVFGFRADGSTLANFPKYVKEWTTDVVAGDFNGNGLMDIFAADYRGNMYLWEFSGPASPQALEWPQLHHDAQHTGLHVLYIPQQ